MYVYILYVMNVLIVQMLCIQLFFKSESRLYIMLLKIGLCVMIDVIFVCEELIVISTWPWVLIKGNEIFNS